MVIMSLTKNQIILTEAALFAYLKSSKSAFEQESTSILLEKYARYSPMARGERKTIIEKPKRRKKIPKS